MPKWSKHREYKALDLPSNEALQSMTVDTLSTHAMRVAEALFSKGHAILATYYLLENLDPGEAQRLVRDVRQGFENFKKAHS